jgi:hypothetical protein
MRTGFWLLIVVVIGLLSFLGGYNISSHTGTEPGYFAAVEAAGYGGGAELKIEGLSDEMMEYYKGLTATEK